MCGIAGLIFTGKVRPEGCDPQKLINRMIERLRHRGPEATRIKRFNNDLCWLAHARLRVTDSREIADQPFTSTSGRWKIVFNGEIYNWQDLDGYLRPTGWKPRTNSDTERLAEMIDRVGIECVHSLDGMFAFGAYDKRTGSLFLARDRFGQKPLYYVESNGIIGFASELSALMELSPWIPMKVSLSGMSQYFRFRYVPAPGTAIEPIKKLEPGQYAVIDKSGNVLVDRFFTPSKEGTLCSNDVERSAVEKLNHNPTKGIDILLRESIQKTVPQKAAIIVSGGIDSTLVAAYTAEIDRQSGLKSAGRRSYTVQLEHQPKNEAQWAKKLSQKWGWNHELITLTDRHLINAYLRISERLDEPLGDRSLLPSWSLAQAIQPHERVAIGGDGGDELFIGYGRYIEIANHLQRIGNKVDWAPLYWRHGLPVGDGEAIKIADQDVGINPTKEVLGQLRVLQAEYRDSPLEFLQIMDILNYLPGSILAKADRASMDWGVECRSPMLNTRIALAALAVKPKHHIEGNKMKSILNQLLTEKAGRVPEGKKQGFGAAIREGSELEIFIKQNIERNLRLICTTQGDSKTAKWLVSFTKKTTRWSQNSMFALSIWTDWQARIAKQFPTIEVQ